MRESIMKNKNIIRIALATAFLLMIPAVAMQFTDEVKWSLGDFLFAGTLLFGAGLAYELLARRTGNIAYRCAVGLAVATAVILVWANLAVGIIGTEDNPANLMYFGVLAIGITSAIVARFRAHGMARALLATAAAQMLVPVIAQIIWKPQFASGALGVFVLNVFFVVLFLGSALLFQRASAKDPT